MKRTTAMSTPGHKKLFEPKEKEGRSDEKK